MHTPVLLQQIIEALDVKIGKKYIDATLGEGGHTEAIIKKGGQVLALDADEKQIANFKKHKISGEKVTLINDNFKNIEKIAKDNDFYPVDGVVFDLGLSMNQLNKGKIGLSYRNDDEKLDMRLDKNIESSASDVLNFYNLEALYEIFSKYSEDLNSRKISEEIIRERIKNKIIKVSQLTDIVNRVAGDVKNRSVARIFQALRIFVNDELNNLKKGLKGAKKILKKGGRIAVISFHSLEDRVVKQFIKENHLKQINKKVIEGNKKLKFERSAKLRIISNE